MKQTTIAEARRLGLLPAGEAKRQPVKGKPDSERTKLQRAFRVAFECVASQHKLPIPKEEYRFHDKRRWRFDFAWGFPIGVAVELQGGTFTQGRHARGTGIEKDHEKFNAAQAAGWVVLQYGTVAMKDPYRVAAEVATILKQRLTKEPPRHAR